LGKRGLEQKIFELKSDLQLSSEEELMIMEKSRKEGVEVTIW